MLTLLISLAIGFGIGTLVGSGKIKPIINYVKVKIAAIRKK